MHKYSYTAIDEMGGLFKEGEISARDKDEAEDVAQQEFPQATHIYVWEG